MSPPFAVKREWGTTKLYDHTEDELTLDETERILI
jgi:hypothetical protein